ncbi:MAG: hypothetical protein V7679_10375 [Parasphingorhabdus sp.]
MSTKYLILLATLPLALSACSKTEDESADGSSVSIDFSDESKSDGEKIKIGGDGEDSKFSIKADGFSMEVDLPSITLDSDDFDMNDVDFYPGSHVTGFDVQDKGEQGGKVRISFKTPAGVEKLSAWYETRLTANDFEVVRDGTSLSGKTEEGDPFSLAFTEISADETKGVLVFSERK